MLLRIVQGISVFKFHIISFKRGWAGFSLYLNLGGDRYRVVFCVYGDYILFKVIPYPVKFDNPVIGDAV